MFRDMLKTLTGVVATLIASAAALAQEDEGARLAAARTIIEAVNARDADLYTRAMADDVVMALYGGDVRLRGRDAVRDNRANHFRAHPEIRSTIIHLVAIDDRVVMHDQVWLNADQERPADIVEVFTFQDDLIVRVDVIQPANLFSR